MTENLAVDGYRQHEVLFCRRQNHETHTGGSTLGGRDSDRKPIRSTDIGGVYAVFAKGKNHETSDGKITSLVRQV